jgi:hypothetical protein
MMITSIFNAGTFRRSSVFSFMKKLEPAYATFT